MIKKIEKYENNFNEKSKNMKIIH